jgi:catechol 2,3-dioxygenase-like lactoylglutathione lyase family enzyme
MRLIYNMQPSLQARDMRETIDFYTNVLGFTLDATEPETNPPGAPCTPAMPA